MYRSIPSVNTDEMTESKNQQGTALGQGQKAWLRNSSEKHCSEVSGKIQTKQTSKRKG